MVQSVLYHISSPLCKTLMSSSLVIISTLFSWHQSADEVAQQLFGYIQEGQERATMMMLVPVHQGAIGAGIGWPNWQVSSSLPLPLSILLCAQQESAVMSIFVPVNLTRFCCHLKCHCNLLYTLFFSIQPSSSFWMISYRRLGAAFSQQFTQTNGWNGLNRLTGRSCWWWLSSSSTEGSFGWPMKDSERLITGSLCFH